MVISAVEGVGRERAGIVAVEFHQGGNQIMGAGVFGGKRIGLKFVSAAPPGRQGRKEKGVNPGHHGK